MDCTTAHNLVQALDARVHQQREAVRATVYALQQRLINVLDNEPIVLYGPPGCGKTLMVKTLVSEYFVPRYWPVLHLNGSIPLLAQGADMLLRSCVPRRPVCVVVDDIDKAHSDHLSELMETLRQHAQNKYLLCFFVCNQLPPIDDAVVVRFNDVNLRPHGADCMNE